MKTIYLMQPIFDDPRYDHLMLRDSVRDSMDHSILRSLYGTIYSDATRDFRTAKSFGADWIPLKVRLLKRKLRNDYPCIDLQIPAFSQRAANILRPVLEPHGEFLPVDSDRGEFIAFNTTTVTDALRVDRCEIQNHDNPDGLKCRTIPELFIRIWHYDFDPRAVEPLVIFRLPYLPHDVYVTDPVVEAVKAHQLTGFHFVKVWPLPRPEKWDDAQKRLEVERRSQPRPPKRRATKPPTTAITSRAPRDQELQSFNEAIRRYPVELRLDIASLDSDGIQRRIADEIERLRASPSDDKTLDRAFWLGLAWGDCLVRSLDWQWAMLEQSNGAASLGVVNADRSLAVAAIDYVEGLVTKPKTDLTSQLLFNMIRSEKAPAAKPGDLRLLG